MKNGHKTIRMNDLLLEVHACDTFKDPDLKPQYCVSQAYKL